MWAMVGVPMDSSGRDRGEASAPAVLRECGLAAIAGIDDRGDLDARIGDPTRDSETGVIGIADLVRATAKVADWVAAAVDADERPLLIGGDCSLLTGTFAGLCRAGIAPGLWMVDGHPDALDGQTSPTGEAADMDLAFLLGAAPEPLARVAGPGPLVDAERVLLLGHRPASLGPDTERELALVPDRVTAVDAPSIIRRGARAVGREAADRLADRPSWLHLDLDVLDESVFSAVTYPQPHGLDWDALADLLEPLVRSPGLVGISVADLEPDQDADRTQTRAVVDFLSRVLPRSADPPA
jgi:arginase